MTKKKIITFNITNITWKNIWKFLFVIFLFFMIYQYFNSEFLNEQRINEITLKVEATKQEGLTGFERFANFLNIIWGVIGFYIIPFWITIGLLDIFVFKESKKEKEIEEITRKIKKKYKVLRLKERLKKLERNGK